MKRVVIVLMAVSIVFGSLAGILVHNQPESAFGGTGFPGQEEGWEDRGGTIEREKFCCPGRYGGGIQELSLEQTKAGD